MEQPQGGGGGGGGEMTREFRKGNWTIEETMILIEAKRMDDQRRRTSKAKAGQQQQQQPLRWKWVEEYCWRRNCQRSQNQCNDKWDNLMRDYKKIRDYQRNVSQTNSKSYWEMDRAVRKDTALPTNMLPQIYQALYDIVERQKQPSAAAAATTTATTPAIVVPLLPPPPIPPPLPPHVPALGYYSQQQQSPALDSESEHSDSESPAKKRKSMSTTRVDEEQQGVRGETSEAAIPAATTSPTDVHNLEQVGNAISRSAVIIREAIEASQEREERRHREIMGLHNTNLRLQESSIENHRQGFNALTDAINNLANSILHSANSHKNQGPS